MLDVTLSYNEGASRFQYFLDVLFIEGFVLNL